MKPSDDENKYDVKILEAYLDISTVKLESSIRGQYYDLISQSGIKRVMSVQRVQHFTLAAGSKVSNMYFGC